ncbi:hypothetical protein Hanom_Chr14g01278301 [Helianthus anomalus]
MLPLERIVNICISGVPFILRDNSLFERIGAAFRQVVKNWLSFLGSRMIMQIALLQLICPNVSNRGDNSFKLEK